METLKNYIKIARPSHWVKQIFIVPGILIAALFTQTQFTDIIVPAIIGLVSTCLIASANYVINEWLDAEFDKYHPIKKNRPSVGSKVQAKYVYVEYFLLSVVGLVLGAFISGPFFATAVFLLIMGILYNMRPFRTKEKPYLDVLSESINNPIRLLLGWFIVSTTIIPPSTLLLGYWMGGAFLMAVKRYAEYNFINDPELAAKYRKSFKHYTSESLLISAFFYALTSTFFLGVFMIKYKVELLVTFPLFSILYAWYLHFAFKSNSPAQNPEGLYANKPFVIFLVILAVITFAMLVINIPFLQSFTQNISLVK